MSETTANESRFASAQAAYRSAPTFHPHKTHGALAHYGEVGSHLPAGGYVKRAIDVALALLSLLVLAPMFVLLAVLLRLGFGRPIFVAEQHIGFAGQVFTAYKFRTSAVHGAANSRNIATYLSFLRTSELDRLPLLISIVRGNMSFVGPQPITFDELDQHRECSLDYFAARPGLVGLRCADRSNGSPYRRRAALERYYVRHWSVWLDVALIGAAVGSVFNERN
jgi:exopolysaccharide production protein ExoY